MTATDLVLVDSSGWLEAITAEPNGPQFQPYLEREDRLVVPTIVIYEVYKKLHTGVKGIADQFLSHAFRARVIELDEHIAIDAAELSVGLRLHMADAIIYATARSVKAEIVTGDHHFNGLPGVKLIG